MARQFVLNGETMVDVKGGCHMSGGKIGNLSELGLATDNIVIAPQINFKNVIVNDFGPEVPADVLIMLSSVKIYMTLIHYDTEVLDTCIGETMGNSQLLRALASEDGDETIYIGGMMGPAGQPLGGIKRIFDSGWHYVSVNLSSQILGQPWTFPKCYLNSLPVKIPIGNDLTQVYLEWTAIPYSDPYVSGVSGIGSFINGVFPYPRAVSGGTIGPYTLRGDVPSSGSILWTRARDNDYLIPMN